MRGRTESPCLRCRENYVPKGAGQEKGNIQRKRMSKKESQTNNTTTTSLSHYQPSTSLPLTPPPCLVIYAIFFFFPLGTLQSQYNPTAPTTLTTTYTHKIPKSRHLFSKLALILVRN